MRHICSREEIDVWRTFLTVFLHLSESGRGSWFKLRFTRGRKPSIQELLSLSLPPLPPPPLLFLPRPCSLGVPRWSSMWRKTHSVTPSLWLWRSKWMDVSRSTNQTWKICEFWWLLYESWDLLKVKRALSMSCFVTWIHRPWYWMGMNLGFGRKRKYTLKEAKK